MQSSTNNQLVTFDIDNQNAIFSDGEIAENVTRICDILYRSVIPATGRNALLSKITYYASSDIVERGFITSFGINTEKLNDFKNQMDTQMRKLREITGKKFKQTVAACKQKVLSQRFLTPREELIFDFYEKIDDHITAIFTQMQEVRDLDYGMKLRNQGYYGLKGENMDYGKESLQKMLKMTQSIEDLGNQMNFLMNDVVREGLGISVGSQTNANTTVAKKSHFENLFR